MRRTVVYFHSLSSPWAYLGGPRFHALIEKHHLDVVLRPTTIVTENGGIPLRTRPDARRSYHELELNRWRQRLGMKLNLRPKHYPTDPQYSARMVIAADSLGWNALALSHALLAAIWAEERDVSDAETRRAVADSVGLEGQRLLELQDAPEIMAAWQASHDEAIEAGVFGTPTYVLGGERFWGQDRLEFLDERLSSLGS
jgi:2-hydroxychromene-2-carboxylate isomerase